jgi:hypothetical protein
MVNPKCAAGVGMFCAIAVMMQRHIISRKVICFLNNIVLVLIT